jgi:tripartite motif-containing protein 71
MHSRPIGLIVFLITLLSLPAPSHAQISADPRGPMIPATVPFNRPSPILPAPNVGFLSSGYRSIHFNSSLTSGFAFAFQVSADNDNVFVSDATGNVVKMFQIIAGGTSFIRNFGAAGSGPGQFSGPEQVAVIGNDVYVADFSNHRVQRFNKSTGAYVSQFGAFGSGAGQLSNPSGLVYNPTNGFLYVAEVGNDRISIFNTSGVYQGQFGSFGAGNGQLNNPYVLAVDSRGNIYAADSINNRVVKFNSGGTWLRNLAVGADSPLGLAVDDANMVWVTSGTGDIYSYDAQGNYTSYYYGSIAAAWREGYFKGIRGLAVTPPQNVAPYYGASAIVAVDGSANTVQFFARSAQPIAHPPITTITGVGTYTGQFAFDSLENVYFTSFNGNRVYKYSKFGTLITQWGSAGTANGQFSGPLGIATDNLNNVYVADRNNNRIQKFDSNGAYILQFGALGTGEGQFNHPAGLACDGAWLYVTEENNNRVQKLGLAGGYVRQWGTAGSADGQFNTPIGIAVDRNRNQVYVSEYAGNRIQQFSVFGDFIKVVADSTSGTGAPSQPLGLGIDQAGNLYSADLGSNRIAQFNDNGTYLANFAATSANGVGVNPTNAQIYVGTIGTGVVSIFGSVIGKSDTVGVYRISNQTFYLRPANSAGAPHITASVASADAADLPLTGDWNGDGIDTPGLFRPSTGVFYLWDRWSNLSIASADYQITFGTNGDKPISGDWDGDGKDGIAVFRPSTNTHYLKNQLISGAPDYSIALASASDLGVVGDWNLDGVTSVGAFRTSDASFHVSNSNVNGVVSEVASYPLGFNGALPITGDWTHSGYSALGVFDPANSVFILKNNLDGSAADTTFFFGGDALFRNGFESPGPANSDVLPLSGNWGSTPE